MDSGIVLIRALRCFLLGDAIRSVKFCNAVVDTWWRIANINKVLPTSIITFYWDSLPQGATFGRMLVDCWAAHASEELFEKVGSTLPADFVLQIAKAGIRDQDLTERQKCLERKERC